MKIAIDFDDCLVDSFPSVIKYLNEIAGTSYKRVDIFSLNFDEIWGIDKKESAKRMLDFYMTEDEKDLLPLDGAIEAINKLKEKHELIIITGRPDHTHPFVSKWIEKNLPGVFQKIIHTNQFQGMKKEKSLVCKEEEEVEVFIDDHLDNVLSTSEEGIECFLMDNPWNKGELPENVKRVKNWNEIIKDLSLD